VAALSPWCGRIALVWGCNHFRRGELKSRERATARLNANFKRVRAVSVWSNHPKRERDLRIDFFRGLALIFIFIDHIPDNSWGSMTLRNFGFSDASEVFVLLAGYSAGLAYWSAAERGDILEMLRRAGSRAREIYVWHLGVIFISALLLFMAARLFDNAAFLSNMAIGELATEPARIFAATLALIYQPNQMNILPMYVLLMLWLPFLLLLLKRSVALALALSFGLWLIAGMTGMNLPAHQRAEGWYFNPFAWQLLFTIGVAVAVAVSVRMRRAGGADWVGLRTKIFAAAAVYIGFAFLVVAPWTQLPGLASTAIVPREMVAPMSKSDLSAWRLVHVLALAYAAAMLVPANAQWLKSPWAKAVERCGCHSLEIFSLGTLLSLFGWIALTKMGSNQPMVLIVNVIGIAIMSLTAWQMSRRKEAGRAPRAPAVQAIAASFPSDHVRCS